MQSQDEQIKQWAALVGELLDGVDRGDISGEKEIPPQYTYRHMEALYLLSDALDGGRELFRRLHRIILQAGEQRIRAKAARGKKLRVSFQSYSAAQWPAEGLYRLYEECDLCEVFIFVSPLLDRDEESMLDTYRQTCRWYEASGHCVIGGLKNDGAEIVSWEDVGGYPDIIYHVSPWYDGLPEKQRLTNVPLSVLMGFIDYGMQLMVDESGNSKVFAFYNKEIMNLMWRVYCDVSPNYQGFCKYQLLAGENVRNSGYAKMDYFYTNKFRNGSLPSGIWKIPNGMDYAKMKKVIITPHFSIFSKRDMNISTFHKNLWFLLYLAEKYGNEISFVLKPHPNLRYTSVAFGLFERYDEYDSYLRKWEALPNAKVVQEADYLELFATSDAIINDSCSFIGEYMYTGKPMCYLTRDGQRFMPLGERVVETYYSVPGEDYAGIEGFLQSVVLEGKDDRKEIRQKLFEEEFDYRHRNGKLACNSIFDDFLALIG